MEHSKSIQETRSNESISWLSLGQFLSLVYHDVFEYPLTKEEIGVWSVVGNRNDKHQVEKTQGYLHLVGRENIVLVRRNREKISRVKLNYANLVACLLAHIPTIRLVGVTGSLAMKNAYGTSDIDLIIITHARTLWITRVLVMGLLKTFRITVRRAGKKFGEHALCLNLWLDGDNLAIPEGMRNLYTAHEVLQIVPLVNKNNTLKRFLLANEWVGQYWSRTTQDTKILRYKDTKNKFTQYLNFLISQSLSLFEPFAYNLQNLYMRNRRTRELIEPGRAFFHPIDWGEIVLREFNKRVKMRIL